MSNLTLFRKNRIFMMLCVSLMATGAHAVDQSVIVNVEFIAPITLGVATTLNFGLVETSLADGETIILDTADIITGTASGKQFGGAQTAANVTVTATAGKLITVDVTSDLPGNTSYTLGAFQCKYDTQTVQACGGTETSVATGSLLIGATLTGTIVASIVGLANGSFVAAVVYQ